MAEGKTIERAREDKREGKAPTTQAGEFVREEMEHIREGKHGARSAARRRGAANRSAAARKAVRTKGPVERSAAARKAARTRARKRTGD